MHPFIVRAARCVRFALMAHCAFLLPIDRADAQSDSRKQPVVFTTQQDHQNMLEQLGITKLRPGRSSDEKSPNGCQLR